MNIIYLRVSTNEKRQDLDQQLNAILDRYKLKEYKLFRDEGSAYKTDEIHKRNDFFRMLHIIFNVEATVLDLFINYRYNREPKYIYVWDLSRIMRNIDNNTLFFLLCKRFNIKIVSHKDNTTYNEKELNNPTDNMMELFHLNVNSYGAEKQSYDTSKNILRAFDKENKMSVYGLKLGTYEANDNWKEHWSETLTNLKGKVLNRLTDNGRLRILADEDKEFKKYIHKLLKKGYMRIDVIKMVGDNKGILINQSYLSKNFKDIN